MGVVTDAWYTVAYKIRNTALNTLSALCRSDIIAPISHHTPIWYSEYLINLAHPYVSWDLYTHRRLRFKKTTLDCFLAACLPYLHHNQPKELQSAAIDVFNAIIVTHGDLVWYMLTTADIAMSNYRANYLITSKTESTTKTVAWLAPHCEMRPGPLIDVGQEQSLCVMVEDEVQCPSLQNMWPWRGGQFHGYTSHEYSDSIHRVLIGEVSSWGRYIQYYYTCVFEVQQVYTLTLN